MANFDYFYTYNMLNGAGGGYYNGLGYVTSASSSQLQVTGANWQEEYNGYGFTYSGSRVTGGVLESFYSSLNFDRIIEITGLQASAALVDARIMSGDIGGALQIMAAGNDVITSWSQGPDSLLGWKGNDTILGYGGDDHLWGGAGADTIYGEAGYDYARYDFATSGVYVRLDTGRGYSGEATGDTLFSVERLFGSAFSDVLVGDDQVNDLAGGGGDDSLWSQEGNDALFGHDGNDHLWGGTGADIINGGMGFDFARYDESASGVEVRLDAGRGYQGEATGDTLVSVEGLIGSGFADVLAGDHQRNELAGGAGDDVLLGQGDNDTLSGGDGVDHLWGGTGRDLIDGGAGYDYARYDFATSGVYVRLDTGAGYQGEAADDRLISVESVIGSALADVLVGDNQVNDLVGGGGDDALWGQGGNDALFGNDGDDHLWGGAGADIVDGGAGYDYARYDLATSGVYVRLDTGVGYEGEAAGDKLVSIERLFGSAFADVLVGSDQVNDLAGGAGDDSLWGLAGNDALFGGDGNDHLRGGAGADLIDGGAGNDIVFWSKTEGRDRVNGGVGSDTLYLDAAFKELTYLEHTGENEITARFGSQELTFSNIETLQFTDLTYII